ncbi:MAG: hypothetical protein AAF193_02145, partial [Bacteroidota bacterium]
MPKLLLSLAILCFTLNASSQIVCGLGEYQESHVGCEHGLQGVEEDKFTFIPPPAQFEPDAAERSAIITVNYNGFPANAQSAFEYAVTIWESVLTSSVPIIIDANWASLSGGTLGFAGANGFYQNFPGAEVSNVFYPQALANKLRGSDNSVVQPDISCTFNSNVNWYYGTDGNTPGGQFDFVTVVLHELGHGLGFLGSGNVSGAQGFIGFSGTDVIYDRFVENQAGNDIVTFANGSTALGNELTGDQLYWFGTEGVNEAGGTRPRIYAPSSWNGGSSYSHLREGSYPAGNVNSLMTPFLGTAEANHNPGPIVEGMFEDMGWTVGGCIFESVNLVSVGDCNSSTNTYSVQIEINYLGQPASGLLNINGSLFTITGSPQIVNIGGLDSDGLPVDLNIFFSAETDCSFSGNNFWTAPEACCALPRLEEVNPDTEEITIKNWGSCEVDISQYRLCSEFSYVTVSSLAVVSGNTTIPTNGTVTLSWPAWNPSGTGADLGLYVPSPNFNNPDDMVDFTQWGSGGNGRESVAVAKGIWSTGDFVTGLAPYNYIGNGLENGVTFWQGIPLACSIDGVIPGTQENCDNLTNLYDQSLLIIYSTEPGSGNINVNGQEFAISGSPQAVVILRSIEPRAGQRKELAKPPA